MIKFDRYQVLTEAEAKAHVKKMQPHMDGMKLVVGQGEYPK